jgi:hypothetical protein
MTSDNGTDDPSERDTLPPESLEAQVMALQAAIAELNSATIVTRRAAERCVEVSSRLLERIRHDELRAADRDQRLDRLERHVGIAS